MKIAICDDSKLDLELVTDLLNRYFSDKSVKYDITPYSTGKELLYDVEDGCAYDMVFLDIYMKYELGIDVARKLREIKYNGSIVFLTATAEFAIAGYDVRAAGYLLKPHRYEKLCAVMDRILSGYGEDAYSVTIRKNVIRIPISEITFIESNNTKCILHRTGGETYNVYKRLDEIEAELDDPRFMRCHRSYIVNMSYIRKVDNEFTLSDGSVVMIRQKDMTRIKQAYFDYIGESEPRA